MWKACKAKIHELIGDGLALAIGGWCAPFLRANHAIDMFPYKIRGLPLSRHRKIARDMRIHQVLTR